MSVLRVETKLGSNNTAAPRPQRLPTSRYFETRDQPETPTQQRLTKAITYAIYDECWLWARPPCSSTPGTLLGPRCLWIFPILSAALGKHLFLALTIPLMVLGPYVFQISRIPSASVTIEPLLILPSVGTPGGLLTVCTPPGTHSC